MAGYALRCDDLAATRHFLEAAGYNPLTAGLGALVLPMAPTLGGLAVFYDGAGRIFDDLTPELARARSAASEAN